MLDTTARRQNPDDPSMDGDLARIRAEMRLATYEDEAQPIARALRDLGLDDAARARISDDAATLVQSLRDDDAPGLMERFLAEYGLETEEGVALMCLAEAYLRTPDAASLDALIADKIGDGDWARHLGQAESALVNASTWALMLTGKVFRRIPADAADLGALTRRVVQKLGEPVARVAVGEAMKVLGKQFVLGRDIAEAISNAQDDMAEGYLHSFDMLGEAARTEADALRYLDSYAAAISEIAKHARAADPHENPGISVKLSALHPRYETVQRDRVLRELVPRVARLAAQARQANIGFAIDAEEADRLDLSLDVIGAVLSDAALARWSGFGVVVQAYSKRAPFVLDWLNALCEKLDRRISVRLVKGAYWDAEIKNAQVLGLAGYPVFTRKAATDTAYLACARRLFGMTDRIYPQFATHNAHTVLAVSALAPPDVPYEFQRLHGMGEALHERARKQDGRPRRIYAPVGVHKDLLAYLVRRLLENGANSSFVHKILDKSADAASIVADPISEIASVEPKAHPRIPHPSDIFPGRDNAKGWNLNAPDELSALERDMAPFRQTMWRAAPTHDSSQAPRVVTSPVNRADIVGEVIESTAKEAQNALAAAEAAFPGWATTPVATRAQILERAADLYEAHAPELMALAAREAGKTRLDGVAEVREAVDFLRYYAAQARDVMAEDRAPVGPIVCISPWNFPLAIFTGQLSAQLAAGNTVVAKPAEQTPLIACRAAALLHEAGIPKDALIVTPGDGATVGAALTCDPRAKGVCFTGSTDTAALIDRSMAEQGDPDAQLVAETGGLNAMIVDSTALPEQAVRDIVTSAFQSAGQRCSALRALFVQRDIAPALLEMLEGAARELQIGDPWDPATDVGPVIDAEARQAIESHCAELEADGRLLFRVELPVEWTGDFTAPAAFRLDSFNQLTREVFGPVLHVIEYEADELDAIVDQINAAGYGLTLGVHSRIDARVDRICARAAVGNIYVNRNQIGAVVEAQPFGGDGLSGTGPKAGGPHYLSRFTRCASGLAVSPQDRALPGPTGERNSYALHPRGAVLCLADDPVALQALCDKAAALGNSAIRLSDLGMSEDAALSTADFDAVLIADETDSARRRAIRRLLAARNGARTPLVLQRDDSIRLLVERVVSEDVTASGGNASLLAAAS
ncbi:MAG: bifunctional proline dehydrogenase/L-glutamate gamma-semialdehyde dehydrogenase PutA [Pseudomonadota bacterium]